MKRTLYRDLLAWKHRARRKPLLLQGARQVGKTWLVDEFGRAEYSNYIHLNFEENPDLRTIFAKEKTPENLIETIGLLTGKKIPSRDTLIFFDEIQIAPEALTSLKYFYEQAPEYHIIAAGSLLGVSVCKQSSFPVGKVHFLTLYPMTFIEYLMAAGEDLLARKLLELQEPDTLAEAVHNKLLDHYKKYLVIGGMPEVVQDYLDNRDIASARQIQQEILEAYQRDFSKYTDANQSIKTSAIWNSIPRQLARENKKFKYNAVQKNARAATFEQTIEWLRKAGLVYLVHNIRKPELPLSGYADYSKFKVYLHDCGLLAAMLDIPSEIIIKPTEIFTHYFGAFIENFAAQQLVAHGHKDLFYWTSKSDAEVDFVLQIQDEVFPLEVKSGTSKNLKSLRSYSEKYHPRLLYRTSPRNFIQAGDFVNLPLYACFLTGISSKK